MFVVFVSCYVCIMPPMSALPVLRITLLSVNFIDPVLAVVTVDVGDIMVVGFLLLFCFVFYCFTLDC